MAGAAWRALPELEAGAASGADWTGARGCEATEPTEAGSKPCEGSDADCRMEAVGAGSMEKGSEAKRVTSLEQPASMTETKLAKARRVVVEEEF